MSVLASDIISADTAEVASEYKTALQDLNSSKPQIAFLTMLADESKEHAGAIVSIIAHYAQTCTQAQKLPCLYLVDSIIKNVKGDYIKLFQSKIHHLFAHIFEKVDEKTRRKMYELRQTWNDIFRKSTLYGLDVKVAALDPAWPVTAPTSSQPAPPQVSPSLQPRTKPSTIFLNPNVLKVGALSRDKLAAVEQGEVVVLGEDPHGSISAGRRPSSRTERSADRKMSSSSSSSNSSRHSEKNTGSSRADLLKGYKIKKKDTNNSGSGASFPDISGSSNGGAAAAAEPPPIPAALQRPPPAIGALHPGTKGAGLPTNIHIDSWRGSSQMLSTHLRQQSSASATTSRPPSSSSQSRDPRTQGASSSPTSSNTGSGAPPATTAAVLATSSQVLTPQAGAETPASGSSTRDPRMKIDPRHKSLDPAVATAAHYQQQKLTQQQQPTPGQSVTQTKAPSRDPRSSQVSSSTFSASSKNSRGSAAKIHSKERSSKDREQLKPESHIKASSNKIKIDIDPSKSKALSNRDPGMKSRDPRMSTVKDHRGMEGIDESSSVTPPAVVAPNGSSKDTRPSSQQFKDNTRHRSKSAERRDEITNELKKVDGRDGRSRSRSHQKKDKSSSPRSRDGKRSGSKSKDSEKKKPETTSVNLAIFVASDKPAGKAASQTASETRPADSTPTAADAAAHTKPSASLVSAAAGGPSSTSSSRGDTSTEAISGTGVVTPTSTSAVLNIAAAAASPPASQDSFRSVDRSSSRKRIFRKRTTPSPDLAPSSAVQATAINSGEGEMKTKDKAKEDGSESDESDHYEANKPSPAVYADKKLSSTEDVDLRMLNSAKRPSQSDSSSKMTRVDELFGSEDVDLRTLASKPLPPSASLSDPAALPPAVGGGLPAAFQTPSAVSGGVGGSTGDQDLRGSVTLAATRVQPSKQDASAPAASGAAAAAAAAVSPSAAAAPAAGGSKGKVAEQQKLGLPKPGLPQGPPPHPTNWDKFREKNPEFKEYQRQTSTPSLPDSSSPQVSAELARFRANMRRRPYQDEDPDEDMAGEEDARQNAHLQIIVSQAEDEMNQGQITIAEYNNTLQQVLSMYEREKMHKARVRDRTTSGSSAASMEAGDRFPPHEDPADHHPHHLPPPPHLRRKDTDIRDLQPLPPPPMPPHLRMPHHHDIRRRGPLPPPPRPSFGRGVVMGPGRGRGVMSHMRPPHGGYHDNYIAHDEYTEEKELPFVPEEILRQVQREGESRTIDIDGSPREIRTYGPTAILLMDPFDPRTLSFEEGHCNVVFDEGKLVIPMNTTDDYKEFQIEGETHRVRLGVPTQELFIDGRGYQCFFGGKPITIHLAGRIRTIRLDGDPPSVAIGKNPNTDYLLGKISLVVNANTKRMTSLFLDAKPQRINIEGKVLVIKFVDNFLAVHINTVPFPVNFGGLPTSISVRNMRKYLSFSNLPPGVVPGKTTVYGMDQSSFIPRYPDTPAHLKEFMAKPPLAPPHGLIPPAVMQPPPRPPNLPMFPAPPPLTMPPHAAGVPPPSVTLSQPPPTTAASALTVAPPPPFPQLVSTEASSVVVTSSTSTATTISSLAPSDDVGTKPAVVAGAAGSSAGGRSSSERSVVPGAYITNRRTSPSPPSSRSVTPLAPSPAPAAAKTTAASLDVSSLLQTLIKVGIIGKPEQAPVKSDTVPVDKKPDFGSKINVKPTIKIKKMEELKPAEDAVLDENDQDWVEQEEGAEYKISHVAKMDFLFKSQQLRKRSGALVAALYRGMQCSSCGMRYPPEQTVQYSHHLDWHFRQNKREQESAKRGNARKFYIPIDDWMQYEEIEDVEERVPSMFECDGDMPSDLGGQARRNTDDDEETEASVPVNSAEPGLGVCPVCHDTFSQFFQHDTDEWHYRNAIAKDGANYHPDCHQDLVRQKEKEEEKKIAEEQAKIEAKEQAKLAAEHEAEEAAAAEAAATSEKKVSAEDMSVDPATSADNTALADESSKTVADESSTTVADGATTADATADATPPADDTSTTATAGAESLAAAVATGTDTPEAVASPAEPEKKKKKKKKKKKPVIEPVMPAVHIKEEPKDEDDVSLFTPPDSQGMAGVVVKQEKPDDPEIQEELVPADEGIEEMDQDDDASMLLDTTGSLPAASVDANLLISSIDGNVEQTAAPDTNPSSAVGPKIRIGGLLMNTSAKAKAAAAAAAAAKAAAAEDDDCVVDSAGPITVIGSTGPPAPDGGAAADGDGTTGGQLQSADTTMDGMEREKQQKEEGQTEVTKDVENGLADDEGVEGVHSDDDDIIEWDEFMPPTFKADLTQHPKFADAELQDTGITRAGIEASGLCCIM